MTNLEKTIRQTLKTIDVMIGELALKVLSYTPPLDVSQAYPLGTVYFNMEDSRNPSEILGFGTWVPVCEGRFPLGVGNGYTLGQTGGAATHTLTTAEMPSHRHYYNNLAYVASGGNWRGGTDTKLVNSSTGAAGSNQPHNNMPPYTVTKMWKRTA